MSETRSRIWRPNVEPSDEPVPFPSPVNQRKLYTKTSLIASTDNHQSTTKTNYNRSVLSASQSYNNSPKPFRPRQEQQTYTSVNDLPSVSFSTQSSLTQQQHHLQLQQQQQQQQQRQAREQEVGSSIAQNSNIQEEMSGGGGGGGANRRVENASPKLVHKQYNSPLDLYSMNNIRKTIEAHTELIAPGVKGINFMKSSDTPINKQSEVYRLVKEEEEQQQQQQLQQRANQTSLRLSPISGQPLKIPTGLQGSVDRRELFKQQHQHQHQQQITSSTTEASWLNRQHRPGSAISGGSASKSGCPVCCECGQSIVGAFAKIQDRFVHPHCFNCATCGTSLKNTGYFTIREKLYCEIHAKQVASMMRVPFNFAANSTAGSRTTAEAVADQSIGQFRSGQSCEHNTSTGAATGGGQTLGTRQTDTAIKPSPNYGGPATISTMFANRSQSRDCVERSEQKLARAASVNDVAISSQQKLDTNSPIVQLDAHRCRQFSGQQSMVSSSTSQSRRFIEETSQMDAATSGGRLPVCINCQAQIHGPYIQASRTTWCKHCSQNHFNCGSCNRSLLDTGFIEDGPHKYYCEHCYEAYCAPICSKCNIKIKGDCLNALAKKWHPSCFTCGHCRRPFGNSSFYLEDNVPYCERDWRALFTTKCYACSYPIEAGDRWIEALDRNYHSNCFRCTACQANLEGSTFYRKGDKPYCKLHAR